MDKHVFILSYAAYFVIVYVSVYVAERAANELQGEVVKPPGWSSQSKTTI